MAAEGFGILVEIDLAAKLHEKLGFECETYVTMEAGDPTVAYPALEEEIDLCLLLPCNVAVDRKAGKTVVAAIDAERILSLTENSSLAESATDVNKRLQKALKSIG
ncbi:MAG: ABC transporter ATP-binding protein [Blastocatellia bacterium]